MRVVSKAEYEGWQAQGTNQQILIEELQGEVRTVREAAQKQFELLEETTQAIGIQISRAEIAEQTANRYADKILAHDLVVADLQAQLRLKTRAYDLSNESELALRNLLAAKDETISELTSCIDSLESQRSQATQEAIHQSNLAQQAERALEEAQALISWPELSQDDKVVLAAKWADAACVHCGGYHIGVCNRIKRVELDEVGRKSLVIYRDEWEPNPGTIWPDQVWSSFSERATAAEDAANRELETNAMKMLVEQELRKANAEQRRPRSPVEVVKEILGA